MPIGSDSRNLTNQFKIETLIGTYNPDWAIVKEVDGEGEKLYLEFIRKPVYGVGTGVVGIGMRVSTG